MKILISNNTAIMVNAHGGYSKQLHFFIRMLLEQGHEVYYYMFKYRVNYKPFTYCYSYDELKQIYIDFGLESSLVQSDILPQIHYFSDQQDQESELNIEKVNEITKLHQMDIFFFLGDVFVFYKNSKLIRFNIPSFCWFPCHYYPFSEYDLAGLKYFDTILCLSPSMKEILSGVFPSKTVHYVPHVSDELNVNLTKEQIRKKWNVASDVFFVTIIGQSVDTVHGNRKALDVQLIAFSEFNKKYPNSFLFFHVKNQYDEDEKALENVIQNLNLNATNFYWNKTTIFSEYDLAELYKLSDVILNCSKSEGFGVPIIEAQLYGTNVLTTNFFSMAEHNFQTKNIIQSSTECKHFVNGIWVVPSSEAITNRLLELTNTPSNNNRSKWIVRKLTSYNNIKKLLSTIII
jgi:hypothetical protein